MTQQTSTTAPSYSPGHPWYYVLGGEILGPKSILAQVKAGNYKGYNADAIARADRKPEPERSQALRRLRAEAITSFHRNISIYRQAVCKLRHYRHVMKITDMQPQFDEVHQSVCLKYNHLYNDFAHLVYIDDLLSQQPDLFGW